jgi:hypothetical protein
MASRGGQKDAHPERERVCYEMSEKPKTNEANKKGEKKKKKQKNRRVILTCTLFPASTVAVR